MRAKRDSGWRRAARVWAGLMALALIGQGAARAEEEPASFFIETITVETERLSPEIVLSESHLREGRAYSEAELREAVHRINRLPFVLLAEFSLRKGSERGQYELVVEVSETRRWFFQLGLAYVLNDPFDRFQIVGELDERFRGIEDNDFDALVGRRFAVGRRGLLFASLATDNGPFAIGYQHYNLLDRNILFSVAVARETGDRTFNDRDVVTAQLGIPIRGNHALRLLVGWNKREYGLIGGQGISQRETEAEMAWVFNSLDDTVMPRQGSLFEAGVTWAETQDERSFLLIDGTLAVQNFSGREEGLIGSAAKHWPLAARQSVSAGIGGLLGNRPDNSRLLEVEANVGHQVFLLRNLEPGKWRELRFETQLSGLRQEFTRGDPVFGFPLTERSWRLRTGLVYRSGWGLFSLSFDWTEREIG